jgi:S1-C subfamily serine protease
MKRTLVIVLAAALAGGFAGAVIGLVLDGGHSSPSPVQTTSAPIQIVSTSSSSRDGLSPERIYRGDAPGVVVITDTQTQVVPQTFFMPERKEQVGALGSGFVIDRQGDIVTNDHVVQGAKEIRVGFSSGASSPATIVGTDPGPAPCPAAPRSGAI